MASCFLLRRCHILGFALLLCITAIILVHQMLTTTKWSMHKRSQEPETLGQTREYTSSMLPGFVENTIPQPKYTLKTDHQYLLQYQNHNNPLFSDNDTRYVLMVTHMRSGSTLLGQAVNKNPDAFYWFEPIDGVYVAMYGTNPGFNVPCDITAFPNGTYRKILQEEKDVVVDAMYNILTCNLRKLPTEVLTHNFIWNFNGGWWDVGPYGYCVKKLKEFRAECWQKKPLCSSRYNSVSPQMIECHKYLYRQENVDSKGFYITGLNKGKNLSIIEAQLEEYKNCENQLREQAFTCLPLLEQKCNKAKIRSAKVIRTTLNTAELLLQKMPKLLVLYNLRHPLAIAASRNVTLGGLSFVSIYAGNDVAKEATLICHTIYEDLKTYLRLADAYPGQVAMVSYEHFASNSELVVNSLYRRLGMEPHEAVRKWFLANMATPSDGLRRWQRRMSLRDYIEYKRQCGPVLKDFDKLVPWRDSWE